MSREAVRRPVLGLLTALGLFLVSACNALAHEIPGEVVVRAFVKPDGTRLQLLIRVPLEAMRDLNWPTRGPGYLDLGQAETMLQDAAKLWISGNVGLYENGALLTNPALAAARVSLPTDPSFRNFPEALTAVAAPPLSEDTLLYWEQGMLDVLLEYPIGSDRSRFSIRPAFARLGLRVVTVLLFIAPDGAERAFEFVGDPGLVRLDPRWGQAAVNFVGRGFIHILDGFDHLLFLLCLVIPLRRFRPLILTVTSFTVAHSITLLAAALGASPDVLWFGPLIETLIAASIVYMAIENIVGVAHERRWMIAFGFGLVHGFGFSFGLQETLQFAGSHLLTALLSFNIGVEIGQLLVIAALIPALHALFRYGIAERTGTIILSVLVAHTAWHWMIERGADLSAYSWPALTAATLAAALRWLAAGAALAGLVWLISLFFQPWLGQSGEVNAETAGSTRRIGPGAATRGTDR